MQAFIKNFYQPDNAVLIIAGKFDEAKTVSTVNKVACLFNKCPKGHPLYAADFDEEINEANAVTVADLQAFHKEFDGASNGELSVVGDFDAKEIQAVTNEIFGNWKSRKPFTRIARQYNDITTVNENIETPDKANSTLRRGAI